MELRLNSNVRLNDPLIYSDTKHEHAECFSIAGGNLVAFSTPAPGREGPNQDSVALIPIDDEQAVFVVADGVGGMSSGNVASALACTSLVTSIQHGQKEGLSLRDCILNGIEKAHEEINQLTSNSATTIAVVEITGDMVRSYHVGDPLILITGQRGKIHFQNITHSPVGYAVESGLIDEVDAIHHEERNLVSNVVGLADMHIDIGPTLKLSPRDTLLLSSDCLPDNLYIQEIVDLIRKGKLDRCADILVDLTRKRMAHEDKDMPSHPDDCSFILYRPGN